MAGIKLIAAAALLAGSIGVAGAQTSPPTTAPSAVPGMAKCWDSAMNQVRNESTQTPGSTAGSGSTTGSSNMSGSAGAGASGSGSAGTAAQTRPAEARGLPECRH